MIRGLVPNTRTEHRCTKVPIYLSCQSPFRCAMGIAKIKPHLFDTSSVTSVYQYIWIIGTRFEKSKRVTIVPMAVSVLCTRIDYFTFQCLMCRAAANTQTAKKREKKDRGRGAFPARLSRSPM